MSIVSIMQPTFIPWAGYFNLIYKSSHFIFLDDVQLEKQSWQTRNRIIINKSQQWISLPIEHKNLKQTMMETNILLSEKWKRKFKDSFSQNYGRHKYFDEASEIFEIILCNADQVLSKYNQNIIEFISKKLLLTAKFYRSSDMDIIGLRSQRICSLCKKLGANTYLSPPGAQEYLTRDEFTKICNVNLIYNDYLATEYAQKNAEIFFPNLSIVDVVANIGWDGTINYIKGIS